jgi:hypothetical protein
LINRGALHTSELFSSWGADCPAIVAAEEDHRSFRDSSKVESSMKVSLYVFQLSEKARLQVLSDQ